MSWAFFVVGKFFEKRNMHLNDNQMMRIKKALVFITIKSSK